MYHYVENKEFVSRIRQKSGDLMQDLCSTLRREYGIGATPHLVGSGARNLITQNEDEPIDLDYNLEIVGCDDFNNCRQIKEAVRKAFNKVLKKQGLDDCQDSTSALTTRQIFIDKKYKTPFSIDVCIVKENRDGSIERLIHEKKGSTVNDPYHWNMSKNSAGLKKKIKYIKAQSKWQLVRERYLDIKNNYLRKNDHNHPSFICYIEAVNNVYNSQSNKNQPLSALEAYARAINVDRY